MPGALADGDDANGIIILAAISLTLLLAVGATVSALIPFYAIGVFTGFSIAGFGMARAAAASPRGGPGMLRTIDPEDRGRCPADAGLSPVGPKKRHRVNSEHQKPAGKASAMSARVTDVMTRNVIAVREGASFKEIAAKLRDEHVSAFPVIDDDNKVIGVVSEGDLIAKEAVSGNGQNYTGPLAGLLHRHELEKAKGVTATELMTGPPVTVGPDDLVSHAAQLMYDRRVRRLPVVNDAGHLVGIVSRTDVLAVFGRSDEEIRHQVNQAILNAFLTDPLSFRVTVKDGVVTLAGEPETASVGHEIVNAIRHMEGVVAVRDRLDYPALEPVHTYGPLL